MKSMLYLSVAVALSSATLIDREPNGGYHGMCPRARYGCLCQDDVDYILSRWPRIFDTEDATWLNNTIDCIVTEDFTSINEGSMVFGVVDNGINIHNRSELLHENLINIQFEQGYPNTRGHYSKVFAFHSCDQIAFRWMYNGNATGNTKCTSTSNTVNHAFQYKGTDLLTIRQGTLLVEQVTTSADGVIYSFQLGADFSGSPLCPGTAIPPPDKTCPLIAVGGFYPPVEPHPACAA